MWFSSGNLSADMIMPLLIVSLHYSAICVKDDIEDYEIDKMIDLSRPLARGSTTMVEAKVLWILLHVVALGLSFINFNPYFFVLMLFYIPIGIVYTSLPLRISDRGVSGNLFFIWFTVFLPFIAGAISINSLTNKSLIVALILWIWVVIIDFLKDFFNYDRNQKEPRVSFVTKLGLPGGSAIYCLLSYIVILGFPVVAIMLELNWLFTIMMSGISLWLILVTVHILRNTVLSQKFLKTTYFFLPFVMPLSFVLGEILT